MTILVIAIMIMMIIMITIVTIIIMLKYLLKGMGVSHQLSGRRRRRSRDRWRRVAVIYQ